MLISTLLNIWGIPSEYIQGCFFAKFILLLSYQRLVPWNLRLQLREPIGLASFPVRVSWPGHSLGNEVRHWKHWIHLFSICQRSVFFIGWCPVFLKTLNSYVLSVMFFVIVAAVVNMGEGKSCPCQSILSRSRRARVCLVFCGMKWEVHKKHVYCMLKYYDFLKKKTFVHLNWELNNPVLFTKHNFYLKDWQTTVFSILGYWQIFT